MQKELENLLSDYSRLPEWLDEPIPEVNSQSLFGDYPLNVAATRGRLYEVKLLISGGAKLDQKGEHGFTPLHNAVEQGHANIVDFLLLQGADTSIQTDDGHTPAGLASLLGNSDLAGMLV